MKTETERQQEFITWRDEKAIPAIKRAVIVRDDEFIRDTLEVALSFGIGIGIVRCSEAIKT